MRIFVALAAAAAVVSLSACGSSPSAAQSYLQGGWASFTGDDQLDLCAAWKVSPKVTVTSVLRSFEGSTPAVTAADADRFLAGAC